MSFSDLRQGAGLTLAEVVADFGSPDEAVRAWEAGSRAAPAHIMRTLQFLRDSSLPRGFRNSPSQDLPKPENGAGQIEFPWSNPQPPMSDTKKARTGSFVDNMQLPMHRWFRYSAGFSAAWVQELLRGREKHSKADVLFDPFAGSGTSLLAAQSAGVTSAGAERHPFVHRIAKAKLGWNVDVSELREGGAELLERARHDMGSVEPSSSELIRKCYSEDALRRLEALRHAFLTVCMPGTAVSELIWLAITSILRECSGVGTAQWQYVLPNKTKARVSDPFSAFARRVELFAADIIRARAASEVPAGAQILPEDARSLEGFNHLAGQVTLVVTSPPYPNNYDYADATRLEMTFWREVESWGDLQSSVRQRLVRSCSQHSAAERLNLDVLLDDQILKPIQDELHGVCQELATVRETKGGRKTYHTMVAAYFADLARVWHALRPLCATDSDICFVIGDSAPYGVYVPVDRWLGQLAVSAGFHTPRFEKIRDRNLKWKNRKHRVPLKEGNLWVRG